MIDTRRVLDAVISYRDAPGKAPERGFVDDATARLMTGQQVLFVVPPTFAFGFDVLGVTEWYTDERLKDDELRLEP